MFHSFPAFGLPAPRGLQGPAEQNTPLLLIALPLLIGLVLGSVLGLFSAVPDGVAPLIWINGSGHGFFYALWMGGRFVLAALLLATTFLGFALLPGLSALLGFLLGCGVAAAVRSFVLSSLLTAFVSLGIPALFLLPAFLLAASDGAKCSMQLLRCFSRGGRPASDMPGAFSRHLALIVLLCFSEALYSAFLLPLILSALQ